MLGVVTVDPVAHSPDPASRAPTLARWQGTTTNRSAPRWTRAEGARSRRDQLMDQLIPIDHRDDGTVAVSMRNLHAGLHVGKDFTTWAQRMFSYGFEEGTDYAEVLPQSGENPAGGRPRRDWALTLDAAKEIAMIQRTERGQQVRRYFIAAEKELRQQQAPALTGPELMAAALIEAQQTLAAKDRELEAARPKAEAFDTFMDADGCYSIGTVAKMLGMGQKRLFDELHARRVLIPTGHLRNTPYSHLMHHFRVSAYTYENSKTGQAGTSYTTKVRPSGVDYIRRKLGLASAPMLEVV